MAMKNNKKILILNTGGTFNKKYNPIDGNLIIPNDNITIETIINKSKINYCDISGVLYKDSLDITNKDRKILIKYIQKSQYKKIIIIHGTDTMDKTAKYIAKHIKNKKVVITGSMVPFSLCKIEATANLLLALGFLQRKVKKNVYISMHGKVKKYNKIYKNRELGIFECH